MIKNLPKFKICKKKIFFFFFFFFVYVSMEVVFKVLSVVTNFLLLIPVALSFTKRFYVHMIFWLCLGIVSYSYHLCKITSTACFLQFEIIRLWDHIFATTGIFIIGIELFYFIRVIRWYWEIVIIGGVFILNVSLFYIIGTAVVFAWHVGLLVTCIIFVVIVMYIKNVRVMRSKNIKVSHIHYARHMFRGRVRKYWYIGGIISLIVAFILYELEKHIGIGFYFYIHTFWHVFGAFGVSMIIFSLNV